MNSDFSLNPKKISAENAINIFEKNSLSYTKESKTYSIPDDFNIVARKLFYRPNVFISQTPIAIIVDDDGNFFKEKYTYEERFKNSEGIFEKIKWYEKRADCEFYLHSYLVQKECIINPINFNKEDMYWLRFIAQSKKYENK